MSLLAEENVDHDGFGPDAPLIGGAGRKCVNAPFNAHARIVSTMCELGDEGYIDTEYPLWTVVEIAMPVVKFSREGNEWIINTLSPLFVGAQPSKP